MLDEIFPPLEITLLNTVLSFLQVYILYNNTLVCCIVKTEVYYSIYYSSL